MRGGAPCLCVVFWATGLGASASGFPVSLQERGAWCVWRIALQSPECTLSRLPLLSGAHLGVCWLCWFSETWSRLSSGPWSWSDLLVASAAALLFLSLASPCRQASQILTVNYPYYPFHRLWRTLQIFFVLCRSQGRLGVGVDTGLSQVLSIQAPTSAHAAWWYPPLETHSIPWKCRFPLQACDSPRQYLVKQSPSHHLSRYLQTCLDVPVSTHTHVSLEL